MTEECLVKKQNMKKEYCPHCETIQKVLDIIEEWKDYPISKLKQKIKEMK